MSDDPHALFAAYLASLGISPADDPELAGTPERFTELLRERFDPLAELPALEALATEAASDDLVVIRGLRFRALCVHHITPFFGTIAVAFVPHRRLVGFGAVNRLVQAAARRPQLQERLVALVADHMADALEPRGVVVGARASQMCMEFTGTEAGAETIAVAGRGELAGQAGRDLILPLLG